MIPNCEMRHENGNCLPAGGFCTANKNICEALQNAYEMGQRNAIANLPSIDAVPVEKYVPERNVGEWDMFDLITSAYYGKTMYFKQDNGIVYSRYSCKYMSVDEAIREFLALIGDIE